MQRPTLELEEKWNKAIEDVKFLQIFPFVSRCIVVGENVVDPVN
jgi:hypothetical protein